VCQSGNTERNRELALGCEHAAPLLSDVECQALAGFPSELDTEVLGRVSSCLGRLIWSRSVVGTLPPAGWGVVEGYRAWVVSTAGRRPPFP
jgi:hypothetical protein